MVAKLVGNTIINNMDYLKTKYNITNKVVVITDGTDIKGIKYAESIIFSGGIPVILGNNQEKVNYTLNHLNKKFHKEYFGYKVDISDKDELLQVIENIELNLNKVDVLINNVMLRAKINTTDSNFLSPENYPLEFWKNSLKNNLTGTFLTCQQFGKLMLTNNKGVILNIVSTESLQGINPQKYIPQIPPIDYPVAKASVINFTRYIATYWAKNNIRANCLVQGELNEEKNKFTSINTEHIPLNRLANTEEFIGAVLFMISDASSYMTGAVLVIDGGTSIW
jgi:NAD(P)-dependent dehydrogenase (short-subunit alcohol dehydrogenase family)